jgi:uncharacterized glyoxalase superfamily protein PhnB
MVIETTGLVPLVQVFDMNEALEFYCGRLGFEIVDRSPEVETHEGRFSHWAWLRLGEGDVMLNTAYDSNERPEARDGARWGGHSDVALFIGCPDVDAAYAELNAAGISVNPPKVAPYGMKQLMLSDPDGYGLCFQQRVSTESAR